MKKLLRRIALMLLKASGENIPDEVIKNRLIPVPLDYNFFCKADESGKMAATRIADGERALLQAARPYIHIEHTRTEEGFKVRMKLIIQRYERL